MFKSIRFISVFFLALGVFVNGVIFTANAQINTNNNLNKETQKPVGGSRIIIPEQEYEETKLVLKKENKVGNIVGMVVLVGVAIGVGVSMHPKLLNKFHGKRN